MKNTKTDGISSGLVAVAWLAPSNYEWPSHFFSMTEIRNGEPLVRLSDAEAIISDLQNLVVAENQQKKQLEHEVAAKDAEIERLKTMLPDIPKAERECGTLEDWKARALYFESEYRSCSHAGKQAERIKELEADLSEEAHIRDRMAHLLAETAVALKGPEKALHRHGWQDLPEVAAKQSAALKLAREALFDMQDSYAAVHGWKDSFVIAATTAIAAIDALGEVK